jgi:hypothetical protein
MQKIYIRIANDGEADPLAFHLLGASSKRGNDNKIGFFGSGNKYALALLLRKKIEFKVFTGKKEIKFDVKELEFRGDKYNVIIVDGQQTSLTTDMGPTWEDWFIIREFYCNAIDEGGEKITVTDHFDPEEGKTTIFIEQTEELSKFFSQVDRYLLINKKMLEIKQTNYGAVGIIEAKEDEFICYRKGIRVYPENTLKSLYRYNFDLIQINESRLAMYEHEIQERIASFFAVTSNENYIRNYIENWQGTYEADAKWEYCHDNLSETWHRILKGKRIYPLKFTIESGDYEGKANSIILPNTLAYLISQQFKDIHVVGYDERKESYQQLVMSEHEQQVLSVALDTLAKIGYPIEVNIQMAEFFEEDVIGSYDFTKKTIYLSRKHFTDNQEELQNTLLEEYFHFKGMVDGQRTFVTFLIGELLQAKKIQYGRSDEANF